MNIKVTQGEVKNSSSKKAGGANKTASPVFKQPQGKSSPEVKKTGNVKSDKAPKETVLVNNTGAMRVFPELGAQKAASIKPYSKEKVVFKNEVMKTTFKHNLKQLRVLRSWKEGEGVFLQD